MSASEASDASAAKASTSEPKGKAPEGKASSTLDGGYKRGAGVKGEVKLPKLTSDNYRLWSHLLKVHLIAKDLWKVVSGATLIPPESMPLDRDSWIFDDATAITILMGAMDERQQKHVQLQRSAKDVWDTAAEIHGRDSRARLVPMLRRFHTYKAKPEEGVDETVAELEDMRDIIANINPEVRPTDIMMALVLMDSVDHERYNAVKVQLNDLEDLTFRKVVEKYKEIEQLARDNADTPYDTAQKASSKSKFKGKCYHCKKPGHVKTKCYKWLATDEGKAYKEDNDTADTAQEKGKKAKDRSKGEEKETKQDGKGRRGHRARKATGTQDSSDSESSNNESVYGHLAINYESSDDVSDSAHHSASQRYTSPHDFARMARFTSNVAPPIDQWVIDSGASRHMTANRTLFTNFTLQVSWVTIANGVKIKSPGRGDVAVELDGKEFTLTDVLYVPDLDANLLSISALQAKGMVVRFGLSCVEILRKGTCLATGSLVGKTYLLRSAGNGAALVATETPTAAKNPEQDRYLLWHSRMGHVGAYRLVALTDVTNGVGARIQNHESVCKCITCTQTKMTRIVNRNPPNKATKQLERVYSDFWGPYRVPNNQGSKYFVSFIDEFSGYSEIYLGARSELERLFRMYKNRIEIETGKRIRTLRCDNAAEYEKLARTILPEGIVVEFTTAYTPEQNGVAEQLNRTLMQMVSAMQMWSGLPRSFWGDAVLTANYLKNRLPSKRQGMKTPYEMWCQKKPEIGHIRTYGCLVHVHIPSETRAKMDKVSHQGILVGFQSSRQYKVYNPDTKTVGVHTSVKFFEDWPGGPLLNTPAEPGEWEIDTADSDYEPDQDSDNDVDNLDNSTDDNSKKESANVEPASTDQHNQSPNDDFLGNQQEPPIEEVIDTPPPKHSRVPPKQNQHLITATSSRPKRTKRPYDPKAFDKSKAPIAIVYVAQLPEPATYQEAMTGPNRREWRGAVGEELEALWRKRTFTIVQKPKNRELISPKWVFKIKYTSAAVIERFKARLCARGFSQKYGIDYEETFAPTLRFESLRMLMAMTALLDLEAHQMDISNAYLEGELDVKIYMEIPEGIDVPDPENKALLLQKGLYGLKQSGRIWNRKFRRYLARIGFVPIPADTCVFINSQSGVIISVYVDDLLIFSSKISCINAVKKQLKQEYKVRDLGEVDQILGVRVQRNRQTRTLTLDQAVYIENFLSKCGMENSRSVSTPIDGYEALTAAIPGEPRTDQLEYQKRIGYLMYAMTHTRLDITFAVAKLSQFCHDPSVRHRVALDRVLRYLNWTTKLGIIFSGAEGKYIPDPLGYADAAYADSSDDRKSTHGMALLLTGSACIWTSTKQRTVSTSTTEAEYVAQCQASKQLVWASRWLQQLGFREGGPIELRCDNQGAIALVKNPENHSRTKHIDVQYHYIREVVEDGLVQISYVPTSEMAADILTKPLTKVAFERCRTLLGMGET